MGKKIVSKDNSVLITLLTPTYNRAYCITNLLSSVCNLIPVEGIEIEHVIVDDGSSDNTSEVIKKVKEEGYPTLDYHILKENGGVNRARNTGIKRAKGDYILFIDSDDELKEDTLVNIKMALDRTNREYMIYRFLTENNSSGKLMSEFNSAWVPLSYKDLLSHKLKGEFISLINAKVTKKFLFPEELTAFESFFWNRLSKKYKIIVIPKVIRLYHDEFVDRLCKQIVDPKNSKKIARDYEHYLKTFGKDYSDLGLFSELSQINFKVGWYYSLAGELKKARLFYSESHSFLSKLAFLGSFFGSWSFRFVANQIKKRV